MFHLKKLRVFPCLVAVSQSRLDVKEMLGVYLVLSVGIVISVIVVGVEIWWKKSLGKTVKTFFASNMR